MMKVMRTKDAMDAPSTVIPGDLLEFSAKNM